MTSFGPLVEVVDALDRSGIDHMIVGSVASTHYGPTRATQDIDMVINPRASALEGFLEQIDHERMHVPDALAREALRSHGQFDIIDYHSPWKVDLMVGVRKILDELRAEIAAQE